MSLAPRPCTRSPSRRPGRLPCAGTVSRCPASSTGAPVPASTQVSPRSRTGHAGGAQQRRARGRRSPPRRATPRGCRSARASAPPGARPARRRSRVVTGCHHTGRPMRYCGIDVSAKPANQQLCTLHERRSRGRAGAGRDLLRAGRHRPGRAHRSRASAAARPSWRSTRRRATGSTCWRPARRCAQRLGLPDGPLRAHARVRHAAVPPRAAAVPGAGRRAAAAGVGGLDARRLRAVRRARGPRRVPALRHTGVPGDDRRRRAGGRAAVRDLSRRDLLRAARAPPGRQAHAVRAAGADRRAQAQGRRRRGRRAVAADAGRAGRVRRRLRGIRAGGRAGHVGRRPARGRDRAAVAGAARRATRRSRRPGARRSPESWLLFAPWEASASPSPRRSSLLGLAAPAPAATPRFIGTGHDPSVAVDANGTAHVAWPSEQQRRHARVLPAAAQGEGVLGPAVVPARGDRLRPSAGAAPGAPRRGVDRDAAGTRTPPCC